MGTSSTPQWQVVEANFEQSAPDLEHAPEATLPEVAFAGRSNVGKSSLLNALTHRRGLARVGQTPGRTQLLNFFEIRARSGEREHRFRIVDLPGYGYAATSRAVSATFAPMVERYLAQREVLRAVAVLVDARRGIDDRDLDLMSFISEREVPSLLVVTKCDKLGKSERGLLARKIASAVSASPRDVVMTSATKHFGIESGPGGGLVADLVELTS